jgi:nicotinate phosphoribosyltransferase
MQKSQDRDCPNYTLLTDLYQLTMCGGYFHQGISQREAVFHLTFRRCPFAGEYALACGLAQAIELIQQFHFSDSDLEFLASLCGNDQLPLFQTAFLKMLREARFECDLHAIPEGTVVFAHEPLVRVRGPLWQCQLLETLLLNVINFQTLIATKASRICSAAQGESVLEFGLRRAQGVDGGLSASRAAFIGGCAATSNVLAGKLFDIPIRGTHAHSWVMSFADELTAFRAYAESMPNNCVLLVDTYDTLQGVRNAIEIGHQLKSAGHNLAGIRLDSGDLSSLSQSARKMLDEAGLASAAIVASNDLDEFEITKLKLQGATINVWGVGTRLATAFDQPALGGVYKLAAIQDASGAWRPRIKLSEQPVKVSDPGCLQIARFESSGKFVADVIYNEVDLTERANRNLTGIPEAAVLQADSMDAVEYASGRPLKFSGDSSCLLQPVFDRGKLVYDAPPAVEARKHALQQLQKIPDAVKWLGTKTERIPQSYLVGQQTSLYQLKQQLIRDASIGGSHRSEVLK